MYIDNQLIHTIQGVSGAVRMEIGDYWKETGNSGDVCGFMFDESRSAIRSSIPYPRSSTLDKTELTLEVGGETQLEALLDAIPDVDMPLEWTVEEHEVAIVENGRVTGKRAGDTKITVSVKDYPHVKAECTVHVHADLVVPVESVEISPTQKTVSFRIALLSPQRCCLSRQPIRKLSGAAAIPMWLLLKTVVFTRGIPAAQSSLPPLWTAARPQPAR